MIKSALLTCSVMMLSVTAPALAQGLRPSEVFVQAGSNPDSVRALTVGLIWPWEWKTTAWGGQFSAFTEVYLSDWRARDFGGGRQHFTQLALVPMLRYRFNEGRSPWFVEAGIGLSTFDKSYVTPDKVFSTRINFTDNLAVGRNFGDRQSHVMSFRLQHISNASLKRPNPGEEFLQIRYGLVF